MNKLINMSLTTVSFSIDDIGGEATTKPFLQGVACVLWQDLNQRSFVCRWAHYL